MKRLIVLLSLGAVHQGFADEAKKEVLKKAPVVLAGVQALKDFKSSFEASGKVLASELIGLSTQTVKAEVKPIEEAKPEEAKPEEAKPEDAKPKVEAKVAVFNVIDTSKIANADFNCHFKRDEKSVLESAVCQVAGTTNARSYTPAQGSLSFDQFLKAVESSVELFERAFGDPKSIQEAKFWRSASATEAVIMAKYVWTNPADSKSATNYMYCHNHQHGTEFEIDCHRHRSAGAFEP
jgi:hypothetical protein